MSLAERNAKAAEERATAAVGTAKEAKLAAKAAKLREMADAEVANREWQRKEKESRQQAKQASFEAKRARKEAHQAQQEAELARTQELKAYITEHKHERLGNYSPVHVFPDRIIKAPHFVAAESHPLAGVSAEVQEAGSISSRTTLTRSLALPMSGWQKKTDNRNAYLVIDGPDFQWVIDVPAGGSLGQINVKVARKFAASLTGWGRQAAAAAGPPPTAATQVGDLADQLGKLAELRDTGALTDAEYEAAKARLLQG